MSPKRSFLDSNVLIYLLSADKIWGPLAVAAVKSALDQGEVAYSTLAYCEVLTGLKGHELSTAKKLLDSLADKDNVVAPDAAIMIRAGELRAKFKLKTPDAIQLASAYAVQASEFITNDKRLHSLSSSALVIKGLE